MKKTYLILLCNFLINNLYGQWINIDTINFENSNHLDTSKFVMDTSSCWQIGKPSKPNLSAAYSLPNAIITDTLNPYSENCNSIFEIKPIGCFSLSCKIKYDTDSCIDGLMIETFIPDVGIWINMLNKPIYNGWIEGSYYNYMVNSATDTCKIFNNETGISGYNSQIFLASFSVNPYRAPIPGQRYIRFKFVSDSVANAKDGIMIDDIVLTYYDCPSGINELKVEPLTVFPNPAKDFIYFAKKPENGVAIIYDASGKMILNTKIHESNLNISYLEKGIYFMEITSYDSHNFTKFIKE